MAFQRSEKEAKYDRQMRLWGAHGQEKLETAHIAVLGSGPTASETLKNLVLPNVGHFTLVDDAKVTEADCGNNFFVDSESIGKPRAEVVAALLLEMNPEVKGGALVRSAADVINNQLDSFAQYSLVVATNVAEAPLRKLAAFLYPRNIPLLVARSHGLIGSLRLVAQEHLITESHPDSDRSDLVVHPKQIALFPQLQEYLDSFDFAGADDNKHRHIPYVAILHKQIKDWQKSHEGKIPESYDDKKAFKEQVRSASRNFHEEENFQEALTYAYRVYDLPEPVEDVKGVYEDEHATNLTRDSRQFWFLVAAVNEFKKNEGKGVLLPVSAAIPDMTSETKSYVALQNIYKARAAADQEAVYQHALRLIRAAGSSIQLSKADTVYFVQNCRSLRCIRTRSLESEYEAKTFRSEDINEIFEDWEEGKDEGEQPPPKGIYWYFALRAVDAFHTAHGRYPGTAGADGKVPSADAEVELLTEIQQAQFKELSIRAEVNADCLREIARCNTEIHNIAAFIGGTASQDGLKLLLQQYVPINNTLIFNGVHGIANTYEL